MYSKRIGYFNKMLEIYKSKMLSVISYIKMVSEYSVV